MPEIVILSNIYPEDPRILDLFEERHVSLRCENPALDEDGIIRSCCGADAIITVYTPFSARMIEALDSSVKGIVRTAMGYEIIDVEAATKRGILVSNVPDYGTEEVAVHQVSLMLSALRKLHAYDQAVRAGKWQEIGPQPYPVRRLSNLTYGLLGFGRIARTVARYVKGFGCKVVAYDPYLPDSVFEVAGVERAADPAQVFAACDVIAPNIPLTPESFHLIDEKAIDQMKPGVIIVNTGRGALIDEAALVRGLQEGKIAAAGLDVFEEEPLTVKDHPFFEMDQVILSPHVAGFSAESSQDLIYKSFLYAVEIAEGKRPLGAVN